MDRKIGKVNGSIAKSTALVAVLQERIAEMQAAAREEQNSINGWQQELAELKQKRLEFDR